MRGRPALDLLRWYVYDLLDVPLTTRCLEETKYVRHYGTPDKTLRRFWIVEESDLQRSRSFHSEVDLLYELLFLPRVEV